MNDTSVMKTTMIIDNIRVNHINNIHEYFAKYNIAKINNIVFHAHFGEYGNGHAIIYLDEWYNNITAENMYERIVECGEVKLVYDEPEYFVMKFYNNHESDLKETPDYREDYIQQENEIDEFDNQESTPDYREDYIKQENEVDLSQEIDTEAYMVSDHDCQKNAHYMQQISDKLDTLYNSFNNLESQVGSVKRSQRRINKRFKRTGIVKIELPNVHRKIYTKNKKAIKQTNLWARRLRSNIVKQ